MLNLLYQHPAFLAVAAILAAAIYWDLTERRIPNALTLGGVLCGLGYQFGTGGLEGFLFGLGGLVIAMLVFLPAYIWSGMAAGDVKLMAAIGTFLGPSQTLLASTFTLIAGLIMGVAILVAQKGLLKAARRYYVTFTSLIATKQFVYLPPTAEEAAAIRFPYAIAIATGTLLALVWSAL